MRIIGFVGTMGVGKDTAATFFEDQGWQAMAFADELKRFTMELFDLEKKAAYFFGESKLREATPFITAPSTYFKDKIISVINGDFYDSIEQLFPSNITKAMLNLCKTLVHFDSVERELLTVRYVLQILGTQWGRGVDNHVWKRRLGETIEEYREKCLAMVYTEIRGLEYKGSVPGIVITDVRFTNEIKLIHRFKGKVYWIDAKNRVPSTSGSHESEPSYEKYEKIVDGVIDNNGDLIQFKANLQSLIT